MTREESKIYTLRKLKTAQSGKEVTDAILAHFRQFMKESAVPTRSAYEVFNEPLLTTIQ